MDYKTIFIFIAIIFSIVSAEQSFNPLCLDTEGESAIFLLLLVMVLAFSMCIVYVFHHYEIGIYIVRNYYQNLFFFLSLKVFALWWLEYFVVYLLDTQFQVELVQKLLN